MKGLESLLRMNVLHRDIKQHNLLVDERMNIRIGDFGTSKIVKDGELSYSICGTTKFLAPEILTGRGYSFEIDRWSLDVSIYYLLEVVIKKRFNKTF